MTSSLPTPPICGQTEADANSGHATGAHGWDFHSPTDPRNCTLLIGLPINDADFLSDCALWPDRDFAARLSVRGKLKEEWTHLEGMLNELIDAAQSSGLIVIRQATKADFARAFTRGSEVIVLVAHWRGARLEGRDLLVDPEICATAIFNSTPIGFSPETLQELRLRVTKALDDTPTLHSAMERRSHFADRLNEHVVQGLPPLPGLIEPAKGERLIVGDLWLETLQRDVLDSCSAGTIVPGNRVELRDGLHAPSSLAELVPEPWTGLIDLSMCRSVILGQAIKQGRGDRGMIVRRGTVDPSITLVLMRRLFLELGTRPVNYASRSAELFVAASTFVREMVSGRTSSTRA
jgi:hypothetical protein